MIIAQDLLNIGLVRDTSFGNEITVRYTSDNLKRKFSNDSFFQLLDDRLMLNWDVGGYYQEVEFYVDTYADLESLFKLLGID